MKFLYVANMRFPTERAHGVQVAKMCEAFASRSANTHMHANTANGKMEVELAIPARENHIKENPFTYYGVRRNFTITKIFSFDLDMGKFGRVGFRVQALSFALSALRHVLKNKPDIIYSRDIFFAFLTSCFVACVVYEDHEPPASKRPFHFFLLNRIPKKIVVAENLAKLYRRHCIPKKSFIVAPNGVDINEFDEASPDRTIWQGKFGVAPNAKIVLYIGHFYAWKGVYILLESARHLPKDAAIVLIGATVENKEQVKNFIKQRELTNVHIGDFLPHKKIIQYIKSADVIVLPNTAKEERSRLYTTPVKLFEYMASLVPIVASRIPSFEKYLRDNENALLCAPDDPKDLAEKISLLLRDGQKGAALAQNAHRDVKTFSWRKRADRILFFITN